MSFPRPNVTRPWMILIGMGCIFVILCRFSVRDVGEPVYSGDEKHLESASEHGLGDAKFWAGHRPWLAPLLHKLAGRDDGKLVRLQWGMLVLAFLVLGAVVFQLSGGGYRALPCALLCLGFASTPHVLGWTMVVRAEASGIAMSVLFLAMLMCTCFSLQDESPRWRLRLVVSIGLVLCGWLLAASRDSWAFVLPLAAVLIWLPVPYLYRRGRVHRRGLIQASILAMALVLVAGFQARSAEQGDRWRPCLMNIIFQRILTGAHLQSDWVEHYGMPDDPVLDSLAGKWCFSDELAGYRHQPFQFWLSEHGLDVYRRDILTHPLRYADQVWRGFRAAVNLDEVEGYQQEAAHGTGPSRWIQGLFFCNLPAGVAELAVILCMIVPLAIGLLHRARGVRAVAWGLLIMGAGLPLHMAVCYLGDAMALIRHSLPVTLTLRLLMLMNLGLVVMLIPGACRDRRTRE